MVEYKRILSLDGGGIKGVFTAALLANLENTLPLPIGSYFDLIVGTSTGGIIAIGLGLGFNASEILAFYENYGPQIFTKQSTFRKYVKQAFSTAYNAEGLRLALQETFGELRIGNAKTRLVITSMNLDTGNTRVFKTAHHRRFEHDYRIPIVEVGLATSAAITFLPFATGGQNLKLTDGGMWANNPIAVAAVEGVGTLNWKKDQIKILSIGCTEEIFDIGNRRKRSRGLDWLFTPQSAEVFMQGQSSGALGMAYTLLGHENVMRLNHIVSRNRFALDSADSIPDLRALGEDCARWKSREIKPIFLTEPAKEFIPVYKLN